MTEDAGDTGWPRESTAADASAAPAAESDAAPNSAPTPRDEARESVGRADPSAGLALAITRVRREPTLLVPFVVAGLVLAVVDPLRRRDPIPTLGTGRGDGASISVEYVGYPTGVPETGRSLEALVDLKLPYLGWAVGLEIVALGAVTVAGTVTIARALGVGDEWDWRAWAQRCLAYLGVVVLFDAVRRALGAVGGVGTVLGVVLAVPLFAAFVRLFLAPAFVVSGTGPIAALSRSARATRGIGWRLLALVVCFGLAAWLAGLVPAVGTILSTAVVGSVHAVTVATIGARALETTGAAD